MDEIVKALKGMKSGKAAEYDKVSAEMLKAGQGIVVKAPNNGNEIRQPPLQLSDGSVVAPARPEAPKPGAPTTTTSHSSHASAAALAVAKGQQAAPRAAPSTCRTRKPSAGPRKGAKRAPTRSAAPPQGAAESANPAPAAVSPTGPGPPAGHCPRRQSAAPLHARPPDERRHRCQPSRADSPGRRAGYLVAPDNPRKPKGHQPPHKDDGNGAPVAPTTPLTGHLPAADWPPTPTAASSRSHA
ncbi:translation initiation factor IF-2-like [Leguminivora glycinivorella]|uniref:translation initiation factor IF-2-like n=1 Tax=Leguminivora glycinivorella TaxID=1035111 RepID=UPI00200BE0A1|nr:translation initiation factor IF-2-like [Leguminivora glycinivorella]